MRLVKIVVVALLLALGQAHAADYCVGNGAAFATAIANAAASDEADTIRVSGTSFISAGTIDYTVRGDLSIRGGYSAGCPLLMATNTATTINAAAGTSFRLGLSSGDLTIARLRFNGFDRTHFFDGSFVYAVKTGQILVQRSAFVDGISGLLIASNHHDVRVENSLFRGSTDTTGNIAEGTGLSVTRGSNGTPVIAVELINNTSVENRHGMSLSTSGPANFVPVLTNNVLFDNRISD